MEKKVTHLERNACCFRIYKVNRDEGDQAEPGVHRVETPADEILVQRCRGSNIVLDIVYQLQVLRSDG
jgi:hypothetical protein